MTNSIRWLFLCLCTCFFLSIRVNAQEVYQHVSNADLYDFLDELSNAHVIDLNTAVKPYSRILIAEKLNEARNKKDKLNPRQLEDVEFYLKDFSKELRPDKDFNKRLDLFYYKDSLFTFNVNPVLGLSYYTNDSGSFYHRWNGAEAYSYIGKNLGFYFSLRDNHESKRLSDPKYLNQFDASNYKVDTEGGGDFDEMRGGITYSWRWGSLGLIKDHMVWGDNYHGSNIFSGHQPSFTHLKLQLKPVRWFDFNYIHGWLVSDVIDSSRTYVNGNSNRINFRPKYIAANMYTLTPFRRLNFSVGNSIVYSDQNVHPAYLIPFFFFKSIDHSLTSTGSNFLGQNSQFFVNISSRNVRNVHLYLSAFVDEISMSRATDKDRHSNFYSIKAGARISNLALRNLFFTAEYTRTNPVVYRHYITTATFASSSFNMGHYLGDNAHEMYFALGYKPISKLFVEASYTFVQKGWEYLYTGSSKDPQGNGLGHPFLNKVYWQGSDFTFKARYQVLNDAWIFGSASSTDYHGIMEEIYTMPYFIGKRFTLNLGANIGF